MTVILTSSDYDAIRALLASDVDELPDPILSSVGLSQLVNAYLSNVVPDFSLLSGNDAIFAKAAAVYMTAALSVTIVQFQRSQSTKLGDYEESNYRNVDWEKVKEDLLAQADKALTRITSYLATLKAPKIFTVSGPSSSGANWPLIMDEWFAKSEPVVKTWFDQNGIFISGVN